MGGFVDALGSMAEKAFSGIGEKLHGAYDSGPMRTTILSQGDEFKRSPQGVSLQGDLLEYHRIQHQILGSLTKPVDAIHEAIKNDPAKINSNIIQLHNDFVKTNPKLAAYTKSIIETNPDNSALTLEAYSQKLFSQARLSAHDQVFGRDNVVAAMKLLPLYQSGNPEDAAHANAISDILANQFRDATSISTISKEGVMSDRQPMHSKVKLDLKKMLVLENKIRKNNNVKELPVDIKTFNTQNVYEKSNELERFASRRVRYFLAPMIAIPHIGMFFNTAQAPLESLFKGMSSMSDKEIQQLTDASGILTSQHFSMLSDNLHLEHSKIASVTGKPEVARLYGQIFHNPGFNFMRNAQLKFTAAVGYHSALYWAEAATKGDKRAIAELKDMQLDPAQIIKQGGELTKDQKIKAIWHFTNNRMFVSKPLDRSLLATKNPWTRMLTMFHGYVVSQQRFMYHELKKMYKAGDYVGLARYAGTIGLLFPTIAPMIKGAEIFARTASPSQAVNSVSEDYRKLSNPADISEFSDEYLSMLSYFGSWGMMHSFVTAAHGDRLALALLGPIAGDAVRTSQDAINAVTKHTKTGDHNFKPLARDILQQTVPGLGNIAAHQLFPVKKGGNQ